MPAKRKFELVDFEVHLSDRPKHDPSNGIKLEVKDLSFW